MLINLQLQMSFYVIDVICYIGKKLIKTINNFSPETRLLFEGIYLCWWCGMNTADSLHHTVGRGNKEGDVESSPLNACLICNHKCHIPNHNLLSTDEEKSKLLNTTYDFLIKINYKFTEKDFDFIKKYSKLYFYTNLSPTLVLI